MRHIDVHGDDIGLERFRQRNGLAAVFGVAHNLELFVSVENPFEDLAHKQGIFHDEHANLFVGGRHRLFTPPARRGAAPPFL